MNASGDNERAQQEAWQAIIDNYGDRPALEEPAPAEPAPAEPDLDDPVLLEPHDPVLELSVPDREERFLPPRPPPVPLPRGRRGLAWGGIVVAPALVVALLLIQVDLPTVLDYLLIGWFVGGFLYLVSTMSQHPREPWDDGSRI